jgi:hypothetical protein
MGGFGALRPEPNLAVADGLVKRSQPPIQALWSRMPWGEFENTNPMGGLARRTVRWANPAGKAWDGAAAVMAVRLDS